MEYTFKADDDNIDDYTTLEAGWYTVCVHQVREARTREGDERWGLLLRVAEGKFTGRFAAWDGIVWSERCASRTKRVLSALGFDTSGSVKIESAELLGRLVDVELMPEEYEHPVTGRVQRRHRVTYDGYAEAGSAAAALGDEAAKGAAPKDASMAGVVAERGQPVDAWGAEGESCAHESGSDSGDARPF